MATKEKSISSEINKKNKEWLRSIIVSWFFVIVFVCAFFWMDVRKNTPMQFVDKMLSWDIVETAAENAESLKAAITPLQKLSWGLSDISIDSSNVKNLSLISENLSKLNTLKESYDKLKEEKNMENLLSGVESETDQENVESLVSSESDFIDNAIELYTFLSNNQDAFSFNEDGSLNVADTVKTTFDDLLLNRMVSQDKVKQANNVYEGLNE